MSDKVYRCMYCETPCKIDKIKENKYLMSCQYCGKLELTSLGLAKLKGVDEE